MSGQCFEVVKERDLLLDLVEYLRHEIRQLRHENEDLVDELEYMREIMDEMDRKL